MMHMNRRTCRVIAGAARGFSLIEVLFAVLILGIALLGLGAFFPSVIKQQRTASDATFGVLAAQSARAQVFGYSAFSEPLSPTDNRTVLKAWAQKPLNSPFPIARGNANDGAWTVVPVNTNTGAMLVDPISPSLGSFAIAMADRLYPGDGSLAKEPQYIWDMAVRRTVPVPATRSEIPPGSDDVQIAVFVRRLDQRIRVPRDKSMFQVLNPESTTDIRRWPLSVSKTTGLSNQDGRTDNSTYSTPIVVRVQFGSSSQGGTTAATTVRDRLRIGKYVSASSPAIESIEDKNVFTICSQAGQKLVDNLGNVYTVLGPDTRTELQSDPTKDVRITPAVAPGVNKNQLFEVVLTPQIPAEVLVFSVNP